MIGQFYSYYRFKKNNILKSLLSPLKEYNENISSHQDKVTCIKCGSKVNLTLNRYKWIQKKTNPHFPDSTYLMLGTITDDEERSAIIPLCFECSPLFEKWAEIVSKRNLARKISWVLLIASVFFLFSVGIGFYIFIGMIFGFIILRSFGKKEFEYPTFKTDDYAKIESKRGIIFRPDYSSHWIPYNKWLKEEPIITKDASKKRKCPNCNSILEPNSKFCTQCGWKLII